LLVAEMLVCPVTATDDSFNPGAAPKFIVAVPLVIDEEDEELEVLFVFIVVEIDLKSSFNLAFSERRYCSVNDT
jgi:hypothetical protein